MLRLVIHSEKRWSRSNSASLCSRKKVARKRQPSAMMWGWKRRATSVRWESLRIFLEIKHKKKERENMQGTESYQASSRHSVSKPESLRKAARSLSGWNRKSCPMS